MLIDAAGNEVPTDRCPCGRHKRVANLWCCGACDGSGDAPHSAGCAMIQEHSPDMLAPANVAYAYGRFLSDSQEAADILRELSSLGISLHAFGLKKQGVRKSARFLASSDSIPDVAL